jgi:hypothetical protein
MRRWCSNSSIEEGVLSRLTVYIAAKFDRTLGFELMDGDGPRFGAMIGLVAVVVATVILVFFGIGYALGRLFL